MNLAIRFVFDFFVLVGNIHVIFSGRSEFDKMDIVMYLPKYLRTIVLTKFGIWIDLP